MTESPVNRVPGLEWLWSLLEDVSNLDTLTLRNISGQLREPGDPPEQCDDPLI